MSYALDSSKRKFHRLLDSISHNESRTSLASAKVANVSQTSLDMEPAEKRRRVGVEPSSSTVRLTDENSNSRARYSTSGSPLASRTSTTKTPLKTTRVPQSRPATATEIDNMSLELRYCPGDRNQLLKRIQTFHGQTAIEWRMKPENINEVAWARRGWRLMSKETVGCVSCKKEFQVPYHNDENSARELEFAEDDQAEDVRRTYLVNLEKRCCEMIIDAHYESCPWIQFGCDETLYRIPMLYPSFELENLGLRYKAICDISDKLPVGFELPRDVGMEPTYDWYHDLCFKSDEHPDKPDPPKVTNQYLHYNMLRRMAFSLAIFGWEPHVSHNDTLRCGLCFRRVGLWLYRPSEREDGIQRPPMITDLRPDEQHYSHCPWIDPGTQSPGKKDGVAGWEALATAVKSAYYANRRKGSPTLNQTKEAEISRDNEEAVGEDENEEKRRFSRIRELKKAFTIKKKKH